MSDPIIRPIRVEDAEDLVEMRTRPRVLWGTLYVPTMTVEDARAGAAPKPNMHQLVSEVNGRVVGHIGIQTGTGRSAHTGDLWMAVHDDFQGQGLGRRLMDAMLDVADNWLMLERVTLTVFPDNARAIHLYESSGFVPEGVSPKAILRDGEFMDLVHMARLRGRALQPAEAQAPETGRLDQQLMPAAVTVRGLRPGDIPALYALRMQRSVLESMGRLPTWQEEEMRKEFTSLPRTQHVLVAEAEGRPVGMAHLLQFGWRRGHMAHLGALAVDELWQGRGVGSALLQGVVNLADNWLGLRRLDLEVHADNAAGIALYRKFGFEIEATHRASWARGGRFVDTYLMGRLHGL